MKIRTIDSGSKGNCYLLVDDADNMLMLEAGVNFARVKQSTDFNIATIKGCLITHEHGDHAGFAADVLKTNIPVYCTAGTARHIKTARHEPNIVAYDEINSAGPFVFSAFRVPHDADEPCGWLIYHPEYGMIMFATDTAQLRHRTNGIATFLIECNYDPDRLNQNVRSGVIAPERATRTRKSHMSVYDTCEFLRANVDNLTRNVILCHLSSQNADAGQMADYVHRETNLPVQVAAAGTEIEL